MSLGNTIEGLKELFTRLTTYRVNWDLVTNDYRPGHDRVRLPIEHSNVITSEVAGTRAHVIAIDLDVPAYLVPSSTPGNSHLYIDVPMAWPDYVRVLRLLAHVWILEEGYVNVSVNRGHTALRLPWVKKDRTSARERARQREASRRVLEPV